MAALSPGTYDIESGPIMLRSPDGWVAEAFHARPQTLPLAGVVVHPDAFGLRPLFTTMGETLASHGLAVIVVEPFARIDPMELSALDVMARMQRVGDFDDDLQLGDLAAAADRLVVDDDVSRVGVMGFCLGGMQALKAAAMGRFDAAVAFYGMVRPHAQWRSPAQTDPLDVAGDACPTVAIFGGVDPYTPPDDVEALRHAWADRPDCEVVVYPEADHGFVHDPDRPVHRAEDATDAWRRALARLLP